MPVSPEFATLLEAKRESFNRRFEHRRRGGAPLDGAAFLSHLLEVVQPVVSAVASTFPERSAAVLDALYDASLDLFAEGLLGPGAKLPALREVWTELLPAGVPLLARDPVALTGCLCNAMYQVASQTGTQPTVWLERMKAALPKCQSSAEVVDAGVVAAWRAGMPQYREAALEAAERLKASIATEALGFPVSHIPALKRDRWFHPDTHGLTPAVPEAVALRRVGTVGGFTGFGGPFSRPPQVQTVGDVLFALAEERCWRIVADAFGVWFQRVPRNTAKPEGLPRGVAVKDGTIRWGKASLPRPELAEFNSAACDGATLAVTIPTSHQVFLFASGTGA
jgi:hypothetical protein